jgi:aminopeptidase N
MENAGAVFFRDSVLLLDAGKASPAELRRSAETIAHELSHMWFGNLVTMAWWNDLWLNESFATWMAYEILEGWQPDWRVWHEFAHRREEALEQDALATSHPIAPPIRSAQEAPRELRRDHVHEGRLGAAHARALSRDRGVPRRHPALPATTPRTACSGGRSLDRALGSLGSADREDHRSVDVCRRAIRSCASSARTATGATRSDSGRNASRPPRARLGAQRRKRRDRATARWPIPWVGRVGRGDDGNARAVRHLFSKARDGASGQGAALTWIYGNAGEAGFFRVQHGESDWDDLLAERASLSPLERIGLVGHQWALARAGREPLDKLLDLVASLGDDEDPDVLAAVERVLTRLLQRVAARLDPAVEARLRAWVEIYFGGQLDSLGLASRPDDDAITRERRARAIAIAGRIGGAGVVREDCAERTRRALGGGPALAPELADEIVRIAASQGDAALHARFVAAARAADTPQTRRRMLLALADFPGQAELARSLAATRDASLAPAVDRAGLLIALLARPGSADATWRHLVKHWRGLEREWPPILLARVAAGTSAALDPARTGEIAAFFRAHPLAAGPRTLRQIREELGHARAYEPVLGRQLERYLGRSGRG